MMAKAALGLLTLYQLAMDVFNERSHRQVGDLFEFVVELEDQILDMMTSLARVKETLSQLSELYLLSLYYAATNSVD
jgi:hypothetical protein